MNRVNCTACLGWEGGSKRGDGRKDRGDNANVRIRSAIRTYVLILGLLRDCEIARNAALFFEPIALSLRTRDLKI